MLYPRTHQPPPKVILFNSTHSHPLNPNLYPPTLRVSVVTSQNTRTGLNETTAELLRNQGS